MPFQQPRLHQVVLGSVLTEKMSREPSAIPATSWLIIFQALDNALTREEVDKYLRQHWARLVPNLVAATTDQPVRLKHDEAVLRAVLLEPIEAFIVGREHSEKADKFQHLKKDDVPSYLCNKNFRAGDPTYSCRECAVDSTVSESWF